MLGTDELQAVTDAIQAKVDANEIFTAYDITKVVQSRGYTVYNSEVRDIVHDTFNNQQMAGYNRDNRYLGDGKRAFVYFPDGYDPDEYVQDIAEQIAAIPKTGSGGPQPTTAIPFQPAAAPKTGRHTGCGTRPVTKVNSDGSIEKTVDKYGRLRIPKGLLNKIGKSSGDVAYVDIQTNQDVVSVSDTPTRYSDTRRIDSKGNIRIGLRKFGVHCSSFVLSLDGKNSIIARGR